MQVTTKIGCLGFLMALSALNISHAEAKADFSLSDSSLQTIEGRLTRLTEIIQQQEVTPDNIPNSLLVGGWGNTRRGSWVNTRRTGFVNHHGGGSFVNRRPWGNGGFLNRNWGDGGRFINRPWGNGGFLNRY